MMSFAWFGTIPTRRSQRPMRCLQFWWVLGWHHGSIAIHPGGFSRCQNEKKWWKNGEREATMENFGWKRYTDIEVSENDGTPKSSILIGFSIINHPFRGTPIFGNTHTGNFDERDIPIYLQSNPPRLQSARHQQDDGWNPGESWAIFVWCIECMIGNQSALIASKYILLENSHLASVFWWPKQLLYCIYMNTPGCTNPSHGFRWPSKFPCKFWPWTLQISPECREWRRMEDVEINCLLGGFKWFYMVLYGFLSYMIPT